MRNIPKLLSKTKIMRGYRCPKAIYYTIHRPELEPKVSPEQQRIFDQGNEVGEKAREYYPGGTLVDCKPWQFVDALKKTRELLNAGTEFIYEAAFEYKGCYARADILQYNKATQRWSLLEVKSGTKVKPEHIEDVGLQAWIVANSGIKLERICIVHLNKDCRYPDLSNLFVEVDVTERLREHYPEITPKLNGIFSAIRSPTPPDLTIGPQCQMHRRDCEFKTHCYGEAAIPEISVFNIPRIGEAAWEHFKRGHVELAQIDTSEMADLQKRMVQTHLTGERYLDRELTRERIKDWKYPLVYLDFETIMYAIPRHRGCAPYQQVPFQFSVHVQREPKGTLEHHEYLFDSEGDPRPGLVEKLIEACGTEGSIVSYNMDFEKKRIIELIDSFPEHTDRLQAINERMVDPLPILREVIYDVEFKGRFSLKNVAPALLGKEQSYEGMEVGDGAAAQRAYLELIATQGDRKASLRQAMLDYCAKDTLMMVRLVEWLQSV